MLCYPFHEKDRDGADGYFYMYQNIIYETYKQLIGGCIYIYPNATNQTKYNLKIRRG